jgi:hypothetical protein
MPKLTSPICTQHFKYEHFDNTHYGSFEKGGEKSMGVTTKQVSEDEEDESISVFSESSSEIKKKRKRAPQKRKEKKPKVVYDKSYDSKSIASFESEEAEVSESDYDSYKNENQY